MAVREIEGVKYATGLGHALIGHASHYSESGPQIIAVYSRKKLLEGFVADGCDYDEAAEHIGFNIEGAYLGTGMPAFLMDDLDDEIDE